VVRVPCQTQVARENDQVLQFADGAERDLQKSQILPGRTPGISFNDIGRDRDGRPSHLTTEPELFLAWKGACVSVDLHYKSVCIMEDTKLAVVSPHEICERKM
jgi:hypothetical protein